MTEAEQRQVTEIIKNVMGGMQNDKDSVILSLLINELASEGSTCALLGCTELPLAAHNLQVSVPVYDAMAILTSAALNNAYQ
jgi:aspartate/glutamate racemase